MNLLEIVQAAKAENPTAFANVKDKRAAAIVRATLKQLRAQVSGLQEGDMLVPGFGKFVAKAVKVKSAAGESTTRRVLFRAAQPKE